MVTNADPVEMRLSFLGNFWGCGFCGRISPVNEDVTACCPDMEKWCERLAATVAPEPVVEPDPDSHEELRWARVLRRWAGKGMA